jgi:hypothetical protein
LDQQPISQEFATSHHLAAGFIPQSQAKAKGKHLAIKAQKDTRKSPKGSLFMIACDRLFVGFRVFCGSPKTLPTNT